MIDADKPSLDFVYGTLDPKMIMQELGFTLEGMTQDSRIWIKKDRGVWHLVIYDPKKPLENVMYKQLRVEKGSLSPVETLMRRDIPIYQVRQYVLKQRTEALDMPDADKPSLDYVYSTLDPMKELGFEFEPFVAPGVGGIWTKREGRILHSVVQYGDQEEVQYRKLREIKKTGEFPMLQNRHGLFKILLNIKMPVSRVRHYVMGWRTEAMKVVEHLLDRNPDAFDPRADLTRLLERCPHCGSSNISQSMDEELADCFNCGLWFDPLMEDGDEPTTREEYFKQISDIARDLERRDLPPKHRSDLLAREKALKKFRRKFEKPMQEDDFDYRAFAMQHGQRPRITTSFSRTTPESAEQGDTSETGWIDEEGEDMILDEWDKEEGLTLGKKAALWLRNKGARMASSSHFDPGVWYSTEYNTDFGSGETEERSFHLYGFTPEQAREVWDNFQKLNK